MIGVDISDRSVKVVRLAHDKTKKLLSYCWQAVPPDVIDGGVIMDRSAMQKVLRAAMNNCGVALNVKDTVVASIPETESFLRVVEIPRMAEREVGEAVTWQVAQHIPFGVENVYMDWQWVETAIGAQTNGKSVEVLVGAAEKKVVDPLTELLETMGWDIGALELESQAIVRSLISPELKKKKGLMIVDLGGAATNVVIHDRGTIRFTASLKRGAEELVGQLNQSQRAFVAGAPKKNKLDAQIATDVANTLASGFDALVSEVHGITEFYMRLEEGRGVNEILLTGGGANLPGLDQAFVRLFDNLHVQRGNPWVNVLPSGESTRPPMDGFESVHYATALGLALREIAV